MQAARSKVHIKVVTIFFLNTGVRAHFNGPTPIGNAELCTERRQEGGGSFYFSLFLVLSSLLAYMQAMLLVRLIRISTGMFLSKVQNSMKDSVHARPRPSFVARLIQSSAMFRLLAAAMLRLLAEEELQSCE